MANINYDAISPGVREVVRWLNQRGFRTTDSGDGSNHKNGMECAVPYPMVAIASTSKTLVTDASRLYCELVDAGVSFSPPETSDPHKPPPEWWPNIQASFDPHDMTAIIVLSGVLNKDIGK